MTLKILNTIGEIYTPEAKTILNQMGEVTYATPLQDELEKIVADYDVTVIGLGLNFDKEVLSNARNLKVIATATTGLDHIDVVHAESKGIKVLSLKGENAFLDTITGTAELALGLMIDLVRYTPWAFESVKQYEWKREDWRGVSLYGKTLGVVGLGRLGKMTARYGKAFGMAVIYSDPNVDSNEYRKVDFQTLLTKSDFISIHVHLAPGTENLFNAAAIAKMKKTAYLINTSRGKIVNEADILDALKSKQIAGYATDVLSDELDFETEGFKNHPLVEYAKKNKNLIIVPHIGGMTSDSRSATDVFIAEKLKTILK